MKSKHSFGVVESLVGIKKMNKGTLLSCFIILLSMTSCKWNDKSYDLFVDTSNKQIQICDIGMTVTNPDGGYIEYVVDENEAGQGEQEKQNSKPKMCEAKNCRNENNCCGLKEVSLRELFYNSFKENICPKGYQCLKDSDTSYCSNVVIPDCYPGFHYDKEVQKCVLNDVNRCTKNVVKCSDIVAGWKDGYCDDNNECQPTSCTGDFHLYCMENTICICEKNDKENCGRNGNKCQITDFEDYEYIQSLECENETCRIAACEDKAHLSEKGDRCVLNSEKECGHYYVDCTSFDGYDIVKCEKNDDQTGGYSCVIKECKKSYHLYNGRCEANTPEHCNDHDTDCTRESNKPFCTYSASEEKYVCASACASGFGMCNNSNECLDFNTDSHHCGECNKDCLSQISNSDTVECIDKKCVVRSCKSNFHIYNDECEEDSIEHCGMERSNCQEVDNSVAVCKNGVCDIECNDGFGNCDNNTDNGCETRLDINGLNSCSECRDDYVKFTLNSHPYSYPLCIKRDESWSDEEWSRGSFECAQCSAGEICALEEVIEGGKSADAYNINCIQPNTEPSGRYQGASSVGFAGACSWSMLHVITGCR